jgi:adenylate cyclase, class 2
VVIFSVSLDDIVNFEVEQKHRVDDEAALVARLAERGAVLSPPVVQSDQYFAHPSRDFAQTDEALRIRTVGDMAFVTYKGPRLPSSTKTRRELELPLDPSDFGGRRFAELLAAVGFTPVAVVTKERRAFELPWSGRSVAGTLDVVDDVGTFVELELMADKVDLADAQRAVTSLADELKLGPSERRSYLELLLAQR